MKVSIISDFKKLNIQEWNAFISGHPCGNIFHTPEIVELYEKTDKNEPVVVACVKESGKISGLIVGVIIREYNGVIGKLTARSIVLGGPLAENNDLELTKQLIASFSNICNPKSVYTQIRNLSDIKYFSDVFKSNGYLFEEHLDILFDLEKEEDLLWKAVHPTRRKQIIRGQKRGLHSKIFENLTDEEICECYEILKRVYTEIKLPFPALSYFKNSFNLLSSKGYLKTALAFFENRIVGFRFFLCYNGLLYDWYAGSLSEHYDKYPNDILPWEIMKWGVSNNYKLFDFGGAGKPNVKYGVRDYKLKFGGELVNFGRYTKINKPLLFLIGKIGLKVKKLVF